jgi:hypothetical protein
LAIGQGPALERYGPVSFGFITKRRCTENASAVFSVILSRVTHNVFATAGPGACSDEGSKIIEEAKAPPGDAQLVFDLHLH